MRNKQRRYSGKNSIEFWARVNALKNWNRIYALGCDLQDLEAYVLNELESAERKESASKRRKAVHRE